MERRHRPKRDHRPAGGAGDRPSPFPLLARVAVAAAFAMLAALAVRQVASLDVGFHLRAGGSILAGAGWPRLDTFTYTVTDHRYIDTSWGYQVLAAALEGLAGPAGLVLLHAGLVLAAFGLVLATMRLAPARPALVAVGLVAGGLAAELRFEARPELVSYTLLAGVLLLLHRRRLGRSVPLWLLPVLFLAWANLHALFVLGWVALACALAGGRLERGRFDRPLAAWSAASVAVTLVNPYGWRGVVFPLTLATRFDPVNPFATSIGEFVSPLALDLSAQYPFYPAWPIWAFRLLLVAVAVAAVRLALARRWMPLLLVLVFGGLSTTMVRNMPLLAVGCLAPAVQAWPPVAGGPSRARTRRRRISAATLAVATLVAVVVGLRARTDAHYVASRRDTRAGMGWNRLALPVDAVEWTRRAGVSGPVLNHLNFGGWLVHARREPVFIDGRLEVMGEAFYRDYRRVLDEPAAFEAAVRRHGVTWTIFPYGVAPRLLARLSSDPAWRLVYFDHVAAIFVRAAAPAGARVPVDPATAARLGRPPAPLRLQALPGLGGGPRAVGPGRWASGLVARVAFPGKPASHGLFHYFRGDHRRAASEFAEAVRASDGAYYELYNNLGSALYRLGRSEPAVACYRVVLEAAPGNALARKRLDELGAAAR